MYNQNLDTYFKSAAKFKLLTKEEEVELAQKIENGDQRARERMINSNLRLAISIANKYSKYGNVSYEDLIQEANIGLIKAIEKYDWRRGFKFSTYACWWIKQAVTRFLTSNNSILHIPSHIVSNSRKVWNVMKEFEEEFGVEPTIEEISVIMGISIDQVKQAQQASKANFTSSIDKPVGKDDTGRTLAEILPDTGQSPDSVLDSKIMRAVIVQALSSLSKREEMVLRLRFGITEVDDQVINTNA